MEWLLSLFNNTLGSNGIGGGLAKMFTPSAIAAEQVGDLMNSGTLTFDPTSNLLSDGTVKYSMDTAGNLQSNTGLASMLPSDGTLKMLGTGGKMYSDIMSGINQGKAQDLLRNQYNRDTARLAKADADVERQREQSNRVWGGGL